MKKVLFPGCTGLFMICVSTSFANAQNQTSVAKLQLTSGAISSTRASEEKENDRIPPDKVITKAARDFTKTYKNATHVNWYGCGDGFVAYFIPANDVKTKVYYDKKGNYQCRVRSYAEDKLSPEIRHQVKSNYSDFNIFRVTEIHAKNKTAFIIKLENKTSWKTIKVIDNEMEVTKKKKKG
ncbi:MAG TPA: hypothetical protein VJU78_01400 [Chitinophagaceae bacterium]|nr:hypothetical protein [Chitinophagaceae bacterium]